MKLHLKSFEDLQDCCRFVIPAIVWTADYGEHLQLQCSKGEGYCEYSNCPLISGACYD